MSDLDHAEQLFRSQQQVPQLDGKVRMSTHAML